MAHVLPVNTRQAVRDTVQTAGPHCLCTFLRLGVGLGTVSRMPSEEEDSGALKSRLHAAFSRGFPEGPHHTSQGHKLMSQGADFDQ